MADSAPTTLIAGRSRRSNAGNRMRALLDEQRALLEDDGGQPRKKQKRSDDDDEDHDAIFQEDEHDGEFQAPTNWAEEVDHFDSDFADSESDREAEDEGEKELERQDVERKRAARKVARIAPSIPTRKPKPTSTSKAAQPSPNPLQTLTSSTRRVSSRRSTVQSAIQIRSKLQEAQEAAKQRQQQEEQRVQVPAPPTLNQAELIELALQREEENRQSLREWLLGEEERKKNELKREKRERPVKFVRWRSVGVLQQRSLVEDFKGETSTPSQAVDSSAAQTNDVLRQQEPVPQPDTADVLRGDGAMAEQNSGDGAMADQISGDVTTEDQDAGDTTMADQNTGDTTVVIHGGDDDDKSLLQKPNADATHNLSTPPPSSSQAGNAATTAPSDGLSTPPLPATTAINLPFSPPSRPLDITLDPVLAARKEAAALADTQSSKLATHDEQQDAASLESRTFISLHDLTRTDLPSWQEQWEILLGSHTDWSKVWVLSGDYAGRNPLPRPDHPRASLCPITGKLARYRDAKTGIPFADVHAAKVMRSFWSQWDMERQQRRGVPSVLVAESNPPHDYEWVEMDLGLEADVRRAAGAGGSSYRKKAPKKSRKSGIEDDASNDVAATEPQGNRLKTGYWAPVQSRPHSVAGSRDAAPATTSSHKRGKGRASSAVGMRSSNATDAEIPDNLKYMGIAPGDEKALMAEAMALPTGSTRSGRKRGAGAGAGPV